MTGDAVAVDDTRQISDENMVLEWGWEECILVTAAVVEMNKRKKVGRKYKCRVGPGVIRFS